jgi:hypothetical protein
VFFFFFGRTPSLKKIEKRADKENSAYIECVKKICHGA